MRSEILQIPEVMARFLDHGRHDIRAAAGAIKGKTAWVSFVARGTSDHAAVFGRYLFETELGTPTALAAPSAVTIYRAEVDWRGGVLIAVSQSGRSPDLIATMESARHGGALTVTVTNDPSSPLAAAAHNVIDCRAGPELAVAATKSYLNELAVLTALVAALSVSDTLGRALATLPFTLGRCLEEALDSVESSGLAAALATADYALVLGRGFNFATALEVALKLKETSRLPADAYSTADFEHGPIVLAGPTTPVVAFRADGRAGAAMDTVLSRVERSGAELWTVGGTETSGRPGSIPMPSCPPDPLSACALVIPGLLVAEETARRRRLNPDAPVGLSKVTQTL